MFPLIGVALIQPASPYDPDAQAVISAIELTGVILTESQKTACNNRILALKSDSVWAKLIGYYGFLGGTAASHAINWRSPTGPYNMNWSGASHSASGVQGDGTAYGSTGYNPAVAQLLTTKHHFGFYVRSAMSGDYLDCGVRRQPEIWSVAVRWSDGNFYYDAPLSRRFSGPIDSAAGAFISTINDGTASIIQGDEVIASGFVGATSIATIDEVLHFMRANANSDPGQPTFTSFREYGSFYFGDGLTQAEAIANNISEQIYQTTLGRQV